MTVAEAEQIMIDFNNNNGIISEEEEFLYIEAMNFLIEEEHNPHHMLNLGGYYYELKRFDLALKYYEMAASYDCDDAYECLGYIWYYGRTGERDYKKAFEYFNKLKAKGHLVATYKVADMYKNGYYVEKNQERYEAIIEELYPVVRKCNNVFDPIPEVFTRLARIRKDQGRIDEAINLYIIAKNCLAKRISFNSFFGNLNIMKWLIEDLYTIMDFDEEYFDFYDLYYLLKTPHEIIFEYEGTAQRLESVMEGQECAICFNGKWYRTRDDFFRDAAIGTEKATAVYDKLYGFEVIK